MPPTDPYLARRRRKERRTRAVASVLVALFLLGLLGAIWTPISTRLEQRQLARIADLPYPDPHPGQTDLLSFTEHLGAINIHTDWIPFHGILSDDNTYTGILVMRLGTRFDPYLPNEPKPEVAIEFAAIGDLRLPASEAMRHTLVLTCDESTARVKPDRYHMGLASMTEDPPFQDFMLYYAPTPIIVEAANTDALTITLAGTDYPLPPEAFDPLRALTATLKPGYTPPTN